MPGVYLEKQEALVDKLTSREREVLLLAESGMKDTQIAGRLGTAVSTIRNQFGAACRKLGAAHRFMCGVVAERGGMYKNRAK